MATHEIESLNAEAATLLSSSSFLEAGKTWCQLLRLLIPHLQVSETTLDLHDEHRAALPSTPAVHLHFIEARLPESVEEEHVFAAFGRGIVYASTGPWGAKEYRKAAVATCYNMALSHHLHGLKDANNAASLEKALKTYRLARGLLESTVSDVSTESQDVVLLALAIANNEGHVLTTRYDMAGAHQCWLDVQWLLPNAAPTLETLHFFATAATYPGGEGIFSLHAPVA